MRLRVALLLAAVVCGCFADTVILKNGDRLTGDLQGVEDGKLLLRTAYAGVIRIDRASVSEVNGAPYAEARPAAVPQSTTGSSPAFERSRLRVDVGFSYNYSADDGRDQLSANIDTAYVGTQAWDGFFNMVQVYDNASDPGDRQSSVFAQLSLHRYLTRQLFFFLYASVLRDLDGNQNAIFAKFYGGGLGWSFWRAPKRMLFARAGVIGADAIGAVAPNGTLIPYRDRAPAVLNSINCVVTLRRGIQLVGRVQYLQPLAGEPWRKVVFDNAVRFPITKNLTFDFRGYNPPNISRPAALTVRDFKIATGFGLKF